jgi:FKBP-type peptidyl-prolyl cis-trans isomerase 2
MTCLLRSGAALVGCALLLHPAGAFAEEEPAPAAIGAGSRVSIEYTLTIDDGTVADTNVGGELLVYVQGEQQILPALEKALAGLAAGDEKKVHLEASQGYGARDPGLTQTVATTAIPEEARVVGAVLTAQSPDGRQRRQVRVKEIRENEIVVDLNHPLAGEALHFDIKVVSIE